MKRILIPFRFDLPAADLSPEEWELLQELSLFAKSETAEPDWSPVDARCFQFTSSISHKEVMAHIVTSVPAAGLANEIDQHIQLVLDFGGPDYLEPMSSEFLTGVCEAVAALRRKLPNIEIVIFMPVKIPSSDEENALFLSLIEPQRLLIFHTNGPATYFGIEKTIADTFAPRLRQLVQAAQSHRRAKIESQLVRRIGHFRLGREIVSCFYDGNHSARATFYLLNEKIKSIASSHADTKIVILYGCEYARWFEEPLLQAVRIHKNLEAVQFEAFDPVHATGVVAGIFVPFKRTGDTLRNMYAKALTAGVTPDLEIFALVNLSAADGEIESNNDTIALINDQHSRIEKTVNYLIKLPAGIRNLLMTWEKLEIEPVSPDDGQPARLEFSAEEMWGMIFEGGIQLEDNIPIEDRPSLGYVPNFSEIIHRNGPLIASKFQEYFRTQSNDTRRNVIIFHPDQQAAIMLASCWRNYSGYTTIPIPKNIAKLAEESKNYEDLHKKILELDQRSQLAFKRVTDIFESTQSEARKTGLATFIVAIDEFTSTGNSLRRLLKFLNCVGFSSISSVALASMGEVNRQDIQHVFYEFGYPKLN